MPKSCVSPRRVHPYRATVAAGNLPAVEPGRPARRIRRAREWGVGNPLNRTRTGGSLPGGGTHALYVRRDARRYKSVAAYGRARPARPRETWPVVQRRLARAVAGVTFWP